MRYFDGAFPDYAISAITITDWGHTPGAEAHKPGRYPPKRYTATPKISARICAPMPQCRYVPVLRAPTHPERSRVNGMDPPSNIVFSTPPRYIAIEVQPNGPGPPPPISVIGQLSLWPILQLN